MVSTGIYLRVSTEEQAREGYSIRAQEEKLRSYAHIKDWHIYSVYSDEGISGKDIDGRPGVRQLIADIESGKVNNVLVYKIDRLTRSTKNLIELVDLFDANQCAFNSLNESIDTSSATGRMFIKIVGIFAEFERENLIERVKLGFERKAKEGHALCTATPSYGYSRKRGSKVQDVIDEETQVVQRIFDMYLREDYPLAQIAHTLNAEEIPTKKGRRWSGKTVKVVLENPTYIGKVRYSCNDASKYFEADGQHEAIIDADTFSHAQQKLGKAVKIGKTKRPSSKVYFCGVLFCPVCDGKLSPKWNYKRLADSSVRAGYPSYRCLNGMKGLCESKHTVSHAKVSAAFEQYIERIEDFVPIENVQAKAPAPDNSKEIASIASQIEKIEEKNSEIIDLFTLGQIDFPTYREMIERGNERRGKLEGRLSRLQGSSKSKKPCYTKAEIITNLRENWQALDDKQRQDFVSTFIKKISIQVITPSGKRYKIVTVNDVVWGEFEG